MAFFGQCRARNVERFRRVLVDCAQQAIAAIGHLIIAILIFRVVAHQAEGGVLHLGFALGRQRLNFCIIQLYFTGAEVQHQQLLLDAQRLGARQQPALA